MLVAALLQAFINIELRFNYMKCMYCVLQI